MKSLTAMGSGLMEQPSMPSMPSRFGLFYVVSIFFLGEGGGGGVQGSNTEAMGFGVSGLGL